MHARPKGEGRIDGAGATRRDFLRAGAMGAVGLSLADLMRAEASGVGRSGDRAVILLMLVGGPSQLDSFDPKPEAPAEIRGPFGSIATVVPGVRVSEHLPGLARRLDRVALVRSVHHREAPIHETGQQLLQAGRLCRQEADHPSAGAVASGVLGARGGLPPWVILPGPIERTGVSISHGQGVGAMGEACAPLALGVDPASASYDAGAIAERARRHLDAAAAAGLPIDRSGEGRRSCSAFDLGAECDAVREAYGPTSFGQGCLLARRLVESGVRFVTVNMATTVFHEPTWDCHGTHPFATLDDYRRTVLPAFDAAYSALLDDLDRRGLLDSTLVVASGEFGRTPKLNPAGGRDHWPGVWTALLAGGGVRGGQVMGASDAHAAEPADRPVRPEEIAATMYHALGIDPAATVPLADGGVLTPIDSARPLLDAF